jgi:hypothetical protein
MALIDTYPHPTTNDRWAGNAIESVRNLPDLSNRPLRFSSSGMTPELLEGLCRRGRVALIARADQRRVGFFLNVSADSPSFVKLVKPIQEKVPHCFVPTGGFSR